MEIWPTLPANSQDPAHEALICPTAPLGADQRQRFANDKNPSLSLPPLPPPSLMALLRSSPGPPRLPPPSPASPRAALLGRHGVGRQGSGARIKVFGRQV